MRLVYEGKAKRMYDVGGGLYLMEFKDEVTASDGARRDAAAEKGELAARTSALLFEALRGVVETHYVEFKPSRGILVRGVEIIPLEVVVRFYAYGGFLKRMPLVPKLRRFSAPIVELHLKDDKLHDPLVLEDDVVEAGLASRGELEEIKRSALRAAGRLAEIFEAMGALFVDVKFEFGRGEGGRLLLADEISGDTFRVLYRGEHLDKEYYRQTGDAAGLVKRYKALLGLLGPRLP